MKVWRVEDERGIGPWHSRKPYTEGLYDCGDRHHSPDNWVPRPHNTLNIQYHKFAFSRLDTLEFVFGTCLTELVKAGYVITELDVEVAFQGPQDQVMFVDKRVF